MIRLGIFAKTFGGASLEAALDGVVACGVPAIRFNLSLVGGASLPGELPDGLVDHIRRSVRERGLDMAAVSGTYNMAHPDPVAREKGLRALSALIASAPAMGTRVVTLCTGTRDARNMWKWHRDNATARAWDDMIASMSGAVAVAAQHDVTLAFEPEHNNVVADAASARKLLDEVGAPHLKVVLDPANLIGAGQLDRQAQTMERAFELLGEDLALAHAKDVSDDVNGVAPGRGELDFGVYVSLLRQARYEGALILHGLAADAVKDSVAFVASHLDGRSAEFV